MNFTKNKIPSLIENVRDILTPQAKEKNIQFKIQVEEGLPDILVDASQFERVFINLIGNAIKFTPANGAITIDVKSDRTAILFSVADTGVGIPPDDIPKLFDEFFRVENEINQSVKGSGLGLALAKNIVEAHGGRIWVVSAPGEGTTFYFTLPLNTGVYS